jgi:plastocyanin
VERSVRTCVSNSEEDPIVKALLAAAALWLAWPAVAPAQTPSPTPAQMPAQVPAQMEAAQVEIRAHAFSAPTVTVKAGTTVTWINHDDDTHTVTSTLDTFRSPGLDTDETFSYTFTTPGTYEYYCSLHPLMTGTVIVTPERS